ncbi:MAG: uracil-DNA glycosylase [Flavobacteriaceae bacterium]|nr:uracil-DNA glycosylase [Flavobacteriaceae bacterium]
MAVSIHSHWENILQPTFESPYFKVLIEFVKLAYATSSCYPPRKMIFNALDLCPPEKTKVVILGQDPYHGPGQAQGLCFSVPNGIPHPPSLINIFKEMEKDVGIPYPKSGDLSPWAKQGVLLLNATLTVQAHQAGSHQGKGWEKFTDQIIQVLSDRYESIVFLLWGGYAKQKLKLIDGEKHCVLTSGHPSPLSANRGYWFGNDHFSRANQYLKEKGKEPIDWAL